MRNLRLLVLVIGAAALLSGCDSARKVFSNPKNPPDEFVVYSRPPLSLPPDYGLRPPQPGAARPQRVSPTDEAQKAILGKSASRKQQPVQGSAGVHALLRDTGGTNANPEIRQIIDQETSILAKEDVAFIDKLIFWVDDKPFDGIVVDAEKEQKRILQNQALGKPINEGETPEVKRKRSRKGLLDF